MLDDFFRLTIAMASLSLAFFFLSVVIIIVWRLIPTPLVMLDERGLFWLLGRGVMFWVYFFRPGSLPTTFFLFSGDVVFWRDVWCLWRWGVRLVAYCGRYKMLSVPGAFMFLTVCPDGKVKAAGWE